MLGKASCMMYRIVYTKLSCSLQSQWSVIILQNRPERNRTVPSHYFTERNRFKYASSKPSSGVSVYTLLIVYPIQYMPLPEQRYDKARQSMVCQSHRQTTSRPLIDRP